MAKSFEFTKKIQFLFDLRSFLIKFAPNTNKMHADLCVYANFCGLIRKKESNLDVNTI